MLYVECMKAALAVLVLAASNIGAQGRMLETQTYSTTGHPTEAVATPDGQYVLVTVNRTMGAGLDVFHAVAGKLERIAFQPLPTEGAQGIVLIPHTRMLAVGASSKGVVFLSLDEALVGKAKPTTLSQGERPGSGYLAVTPDGQVLFVANEYGDGGNIGVIALHPDSDGALHPENIAQIPTRNTTPGVAISPDGSRLYTEGEVVPPGVAAKLPGHDIKELERSGCSQARPERQMPNGVLYAIDVAAARTLTKTSSPEQVRHTVIGLVDSGCSPVREAITPDGKILYVTARGDNQILIFATKALETNPGNSFLRAFASGGTAPVGLKLFNGGTALLVANSNRFSGGTGNVAVFDLADPAAPVLRQTIKTGPFPRNITSSDDGTTLYLTIFSGDELMVLKSTN